MNALLINVSNKLLSHWLRKSCILPSHRRWTHPKQSPHSYSWCPTKPAQPAFQSIQAQISGIGSKRDKPLPGLFGAWSSHRHWALDQCFLPCPTLRMAVGKWVWCPKARMWWLLRMLAEGREKIFACEEAAGNPLWTVDLSVGLIFNDPLHTTGKTPNQLFMETWWTIGVESFLRQYHDFFVALQIVLS